MNHGAMKEKENVAKKLLKDEGEYFREVLSKVNTYSQRAIAKGKKHKTIKDCFKL